MTKCSAATTKKLNSEMRLTLGSVFWCKQLVHRRDTAKTDPWINLPGFTGDPIRMKQNWQLRSQKQLYQVIQDTQMSFLLLSSGMQITLSIGSPWKEAGAPWPPNGPEMELDQMNIPRHYWIFRNHRGDETSAVSLRAQAPANGVVGKHTFVCPSVRPSIRVLHVAP